MAAVGIPALPSRKPVLPRAARKLRDLARAGAAAVVAPHKASLRRLADIPLSVAGTAGIDFAAWHLGHGWGWLVTGASLFVLEHMIADPDPGVGGV